VRSRGSAAAGALRIEVASASCPPRRGSGYAQLSRQVKEAGLLELRSAYYIWKITLTVAALAAGWAAFLVAGDSWWQLAVAAFLAVVFTQIGFLGHDAGHRQIFGTRRASYVAGVLLGNLGIGLSYGWWVGKHNRHHAHPNQEDADPDIAVGVLAFTAAQARASRGLARLAFRYQAARPAWQAPTPRPCVTSTPSAGQPPVPRPDRRPVRSAQRPARAVAGVIHRVWG
jgi:fatty acid desaturase